MIKYLQLPFQFDASRMLQEIQQMDGAKWQEHYQKLHYEGDWSAIALRSTDGNADNIIISPVENALYSNTGFLEGCPYLEEVLASFNCPLLSVRLLKLNTGAIIKEHRDAELNFEKGEMRLHIPVLTAPDVEFFLDKERIDLKEGECWYMNFNLPHSVHNKSSVNRIHLVIDAKVNDWVKNLFQSPGILIKKETEEPPKHTKEECLLIIAQLRRMNTEVSNNLATEMEKQLN